jgi:hypothetical protein
MFQFGFDEAQEMLLVHAGGVMDVCVHLSDIVVISMRNSLGIEHFLSFVQKDIEIPFPVEVLESLVSKRLALSI